MASAFVENKIENKINKTRGFKSTLVKRKYGG